MKKKILFVLAAFDKGGIEKVTLDIVNNLDPEKYDITVYTLWYGGYCQSLVKSHIKVKPFYFKRYVIGIHRLEKYLSSSLLYGLFIRGKYDIEIAAGDGICSKIVAGSRNRRSKKISWIHMDVVARGGMFKSRAAALKIYHKFDKIVCVSQGCKEKFVDKFGCFPDIEVVYNPIPKEVILAKAEEPVEDNVFDKSTLNLVSVGRLEIEKGYDRLINCYEKLVYRDGLNFRAYIIGEGTQRNNLERMIREKKLERFVFLLGFKENPYKYLKHGNIIILPSRDEAFSLIVGEAIILHKVVVATDCAGIREWLGESDYGLVVTNTEMCLYNGIKQILTDSKLRAHYAEKLYEREQNISFNVALQKFEDICLTTD